MIDATVENEDEIKERDRIDGLRAIREWLAMELPDISCELNYGCYKTLVSTNED